MSDDSERARSTLRRYGWHAFSSCLMYEDVSRYWCRNTDGFVGYLTGPGVHMAIGEPVCAATDQVAAAREFSAFSRSRNADCLFVAVGQRFIDAVADPQAVAVSIGDDLIFDVATYPPPGIHAKKIRSSVRQLARRGGRAVEYGRTPLPDAQLEGAFESLVAAWRRGENRLHFLDVHLFRFAEFKRYFYVELGGEVVGLLTCLPIFARNGYFFEDAIRHPDAPPGVIEMMVLEAIARFAAEGRSMATFGPSLRPDRAGCRNLRWYEQAITGGLIQLANRLGQLPDHYFSRKKFGTVHSEPLYLMMWRDDMTWRGLFRVLRHFHVI